MNIISLVATPTLTKY